MQEVNKVSSQNPSQPAGPRETIPQLYLVQLVDTSIFFTLA